MRRAVSRLGQAWETSSALPLATLGWAYLAYAFLLHALGISGPPVCLFRLITGHLCPLCGMTRAIGTLLDGNVAAAISLNRFVLPFFAGWSAMTAVCTAMSARIPVSERGVTRSAPASLAAATLILLGNTAHAEESAKAALLPSKIVAILDRTHAGWALAQPSSQTLAECGWSENDTGMGPTLVWGDFMGNGSRDYAAEIDAAGVRYVLAFVRTANGYTVHELSRGEYPDILTIARAGGQYHDYEKDADRTYPADSPVEIYCEKAAIAYIFKHGQFKKVWVSD